MKRIALFLCLLTGIIAHLIGFGARYDFKHMPVGLFVNPYAKRHKLGGSSLDKDHARTSEKGFRFGIVYHLQ